MPIRCAAESFRRSALPSTTVREIRADLTRVLRRGLLILASMSLLAACAPIKYTVDDGRPVDETLLHNIRLLGAGERALRPAVVRSSGLNDPDCSRQWELPFSVATSYEREEDERVAWVRALQVDERLTVVGTDHDCGLEAGDKLIDLDGYQKNNSNKMLLELLSLRDSGKPFPVRTAAGKTAIIKPVRVCRGYARLAPPEKPRQQDYHWLMSVHPLELFEPAVTPEEALWMVLWTQGVSEEGGGRMKTFHYTKEVVLTLFDVASIAVGISGAAEAAKIAGKEAMSAAGAAATKAASEAAARQILEEAAKEAAKSEAKEYAQKIAVETAKAFGKQVSIAVRDTFMARLGMSVSSVSWVASTAFDDADAWAFDRMSRLGADPLAGATLHRKLVDRGLVSNGFALDEERLAALALHAQKTQREEMLMAAFRGASLAPFAFQLTELPSASAQGEVLAMPAELPEASRHGAPAAASDLPFSMPTESETL